jgi:serine/threonine-protein kinase
MDGQRWRRISTLVDQALAIDEPDRRKAWLDANCEDDELKQEVESLVAAHFEATGFLEGSAVDESAPVLAERLEAQWIGRSVGAWTIVEPIHSGGMGSVFLARRDADDFEQTAAIKIIRNELADQFLLDRFVQERQLLARLEHPNISRLLDGGMTETGLPWLAMDYVDGDPINQWCDDQKLGIDERLELFEQVCDAVSYAHQQLIIHRDIKPDNILVNRNGAPKLLDFGIAKLEPRDGQYQHTITSQRVLTPAYASPEQILGHIVTTATDIYSLGMLLYELLCGQPPYRIDTSRSPLELAEQICRDLPKPPSQQLQASTDPETGRTLAARRGMSLDQLKRELRGDLDVIIMKALRKEPERRYPSVYALREDLRRYRQGLPVSARPDTLRYRSSRFLRRHWLGVSATSALVLSLFIGLAVAVVQADRLRTERDRTVQVNQFLQDLLVEADPFEAGADTTIRDLLVTAGDMVDERFSEQPDLEASLRLTLGKTQLNLMELDAAETNILRAVELNRRLFGPDDERTLTAANWRAWLAFRRGEVDRARELYEGLLERLGPSHAWQTRAETLNEYAITLVESGRIAEARSAYEQALDLWKRHDPDNIAVAILYNNIAGTWRNQDQTDRAVAGYRRSLERLRQHFPESDNPYLASTMTNLAVMLHAEDTADEALGLFQEALEIRRATLGADHVGTGMGHILLARLLIDLGQHDRARGHVERGLEIARAQLDSDQLQVLLVRAARARLLEHDGKTVQAIQEWSDVLERMRRIDAPRRHIDEVSAWLRSARAETNIAQGQ